jgi:hypothetical protein
LEQRVFLYLRLMAEMTTLGGIQASMFGGGQETRNWPPPFAFITHSLSL